MAENRMADVARLFGKKINEEFIVDFDGEIYDCKFTEEGFKSCFIGDSLYDDDESLLETLILGDAMIVEAE